MRDDGTSKRPSFGTAPDARRDRPEPWFVGNGRGLMIGVVAIVVLLIALRVVLAVRMAEAAWDWWRAPTSQRPSSSMDDIPALPIPPVPATDPKQAGAPLRGNAGAAFGPDIYPAESALKGEQGRAVARLTVGPNGAVTRCTIVTSSRYERLDRRTCLMAITRVRFHPARDAAGKPIASIYIMPVRWVLPND